MAWHRGPSLMEQLDAVETPGTESSGAFRMPVQWVNRRGADFRGYCGRIAAGSVRAGDKVRVLPSGVETRVAALFEGFHAPTAADGDASITLTFADEVAASRGDVIASGD